MNLPLLRCLLSGAVGLAILPLAARSDAGDLRDELTTQVDRNIDAGRQMVSEAHARVWDLPGEPQRQFAAAEREVHEAERRLRRSLLAAQIASAHEWEHARRILASDYEAYFQAVAQAQRIAAVASAGSASASSTVERPAVD